MAEPQSPLERAFFRQDEQGATIFFPWGLAHRGYRLPDERARQRAGRAAAALFAGVTGVGVWSGHLLFRLMQDESASTADALAALAVPVALLLAAIACYALYCWRLVERCAESPLVVPRDERLREAAAATEPWKLALIGLGMAAASGLVAWLDPRAVWLGAAGIATGLGLVLWSGRLRRYASRPAERSAERGSEPG